MSQYSLFVFLGLGLAGALLGSCLGLLGTCALLGLLAGLLLAQQVLLVEVLDVLAHRLCLLVEHLDLILLIADGGEQRVELLVVDAHGILLLDTHDEVGKDVHVVGECVEGGIVGRELRVDGTVVHVLGRHVEEVVGRLEIVPVLLEAAVVAEAHALAYAIELGKRLVLQLVAQPCRGVACLVGPRDGVNDRELAYGLELADGLGGGPELQTLLGGKAGQSLEELEDAGLAGLEVAEYLEIHEQVDDLLLGGRRGDPVDILVGGEGILVPSGVREAVRDVVRQLVVLQQYLEVGSRGCAIYIVGRLPAEDVLGTLGDDTLVSHGEDLGCQIVAIDQLGVAEHLGLLTEELLDLLVVHLDLTCKLVGIGQRGQRVGIGLGEELDATRGGEFLEEVDELGHIHLELLEGGAGDRDGTLEGALRLLDHAQQRLCGGDVRALGYTGDDVVVGEIVIVVVVVAYVEETVSLQTERLVNLKVETDCFHIDLEVFWFLGLIFSL